VNDCIFCKIAAGEVPAAIVYQNETLVAIDDLNPQAPTHLLVMPRKHYATLADFIADGKDDGTLVASLFETAARLGREHGGGRGFRLVINTGTDGGQTVGHLHIHVLAGRRMTWPPG
jgi:histidine triad (HIT) family protein